MKKVFQVVMNGKEIDTLLMADVLPNYEVVTDFETLWIQTDDEHTNEAMKIAIDAATILTNCGVLAVKEI